MANERCDFVRKNQLGQGVEFTWFRQITSLWMIDGKLIFAVGFNLVDLKT